MEVEVGSSAPGGSGTNVTERFIGKYKIMQEIGRGTYGEVYKAMDQETREIVALKKTITRVCKNEDEGENIY